MERDIYDPNEFQEEIDPYIPISDFPVDRKKRDTYNYQTQQYQPQTVYHSPGPVYSNPGVSGPVYNHPRVYPIEEDPSRPNQPTFFGNLLFGKVKKVKSYVLTFVQNYS